MNPRSTDCEADALTTAPSRQHYMIAILCELCFDSDVLKVALSSFDTLLQWFSNCASRRPDASFQFSKGVAGYFGFMPLSLGFIASKEL